MNAKPTEPQWFKQMRDQQWKSARRTSWRTLGIAAMVSVAGSCLWWLLTLLPHTSGNNLETLNWPMAVAGPYLIFGTFIILIASAGTMAYLALNAILRELWNIVRWSWTRLFGKK